MLAITSTKTSLHRARGQPVTRVNLSGFRGRMTDREMKRKRRKKEEDRTRIVRVTTALHGRENLRGLPATSGVGRNSPNPREDPTVCYNPFLLRGATEKKEERETENQRERETKINR